jgi:nicotinate phosphoribosyltransferase
LQNVHIPHHAQFVDVRSRVMEKGKPSSPSPTLESAADRTARELKLLPDGCHRLVNPHIYKVSLSAGLNELRLELIAQVQSKFSH